MNQLKTCGLIAVLPALNEAGTIVSVVQSIKHYADVVVVDDGSTDNTSYLARTAGAFIVNHSHNRGYDKALESGLLWAASQGYRYAVTLDADGQHSAASLPLFVCELDAGADLVIGVRDRKQRWAESLFSIVSKILWKIDDPLCGMKGYRLQIINAVGKIDTYTSVGSEYCIRAARSGCRIHQIPISTSTRIGASRFGGGLRANLRIVRAMCLGIFRASAFTYP
jgi:glycosyltransferase involved in cell wall biosynthesis